MSLLTRITVVKYRQIPSRNVRGPIGAMSAGPMPPSVSNDMELALTSATGASTRGRERGQLAHAHGMRRAARRA
eukprot:6254204-Prymnesium_polylepis.1